LNSIVRNLKKQLKGKKKKEVSNILIIGNNDDEHTHQGMLYIYVHLNSYDYKYILLIDLPGSKHSMCKF